jgi:hypothetical protein
VQVNLMMLKDQDKGVSAILWREIDHEAVEMVYTL